MDKAETHFESCRDTRGTDPRADSPDGGYGSGIGKDEIAGKRLKKLFCPIGGAVGNGFLRA
jgi:hypothetical protein